MSLLRTAATVVAISVAACGGRVVVDNGSSGGNGGMGGRGGMGGMGVGAFPNGPGGLGGMSTGDVNPVGTGTGGFGGTMGTMSTGDVNPVGVGVGGSPSTVGVGPGMCMSFSCVEGSNGNCACKGQCADGTSVTVSCGVNSGCHCRKNGQLVGTCEPTPNGCQFPGSCCDAFF